jgi:hypothetical protein
MPRYGSRAFFFSFFFELCFLLTRCIVLYCIALLSCEFFASCDVAFYRTILLPHSQGFGGDTMVMARLQDSSRLHFRLEALSKEFQLTAPKTVFLSFFLSLFLYLFLSFFLSFFLSLFLYLFIYLFIYFFLYFFISFFLSFCLSFFLLFFVCKIFMRVEYGRSIWGLQKEERWY